MRRIAPLLVLVTLSLGLIGCARWRGKRIAFTVVDEGVRQVIILTNKGCALIHFRGDGRCGNSYIATQSLNRLFRRSTSHGIC